MPKIVRLVFPSKNPEDRLGWLEKSAIWGTVLVLAWCLPAWIWRWSA